MSELIEWKVMTLLYTFTIFLLLSYYDLNSILSRNELELSNSLRYSLSSIVSKRVVSLLSYQIMADFHVSDRHKLCLQMSILY